MGEVAISMKGVSKRYDVHENQRSRLVHALWPGYRRGMREVWALRDVDLAVRRGESVAVIGRNGGGKSTLLQILTGVLAPSGGEVAVDGRVCALLELGSGFNPEYTGRDNVLLNGLLLGVERERILRRFDEVAAFADIGDAMERPVKTYSSGMVMRLAFAAQLLADPEILVVDEALSVGDFFFQQKCFRHVRTLVERGVTLIIVSHDLRTVRDVCNRGIYLRQGRVEFDGAIAAAIRHYLAETDTPSDWPGRLAEGGEMAGADEFVAILRDAAWKADDTGSSGRLLAVALYDEAGRPSASFRMGSALHLKVAYRPAESVATHVTAVIRNRYDQVITSVGSSRLGLEPPAADASTVAIFEMRVELRLEAGSYSVSVGLAEWLAPNHGRNLDSSPSIGPLTIHWDYEREVAPFLGMVGLNVVGAFRTLEVPE